MNVLSNLVNIVLSIYGFLFDFTDSGGNPFFIVFSVFILANILISLFMYVFYWRK